MNTRHLRPEDLRGLRWRGYLRESTQAQAEKWSPERQRQDILRAAAELGLEPAEPCWYERTGSGECRSGELLSALADARAGAYDVLMVLTTSRFARNRTEAVKMKGEFSKTKTLIYFCQERILSGARQTALLEGVKEVVDAEENEVRRMWIAGGHRERMLSGRWLGAIPSGYCKAIVDFPDGTRGWDGGLEPSNDAAAVRTIFDAFAAGAEPRDIALRLNADGHRSARGPWSRAQVVKVLRNPVYAGRLVRYRLHRDGHYFAETDEHDGRREMEGGWQPLVSTALWENVQRLLDGRASVGTRAQGRRRYPLSAVMRCGKCGHRFSGVQGGNGRRYYRCSKRAGDGTCDAPSIRADDAEATLARWLAAIRLPEDWRAAIAHTREPEPDTSGRAKLEERLSKMRDLYSWGDINAGAYRAETSAIREQIALLSRPAPATIETVARGLTRIGPHWLTAPPEQQVRVVTSLLRAAIVEDGVLAALVVHGELRPLVDLCVPSDLRLSAENVRYTFG